MTFPGIRPRPCTRPGGLGADNRGFSLVELAVSILVLTVVLGAMMQFMGMLQQRYTREQRVAGASQTGKTVMELLALDINQAGYYPGVSTTAPAAIPALPSNQPVIVDSTTGIFQDQVLLVDVGVDQETVHVVSCTTTTGTQTNCASGGSNSITGLFKKTHTTTVPVPIRSSEVPYPDGILSPLVMSGCPTSCVFAVSTTGSNATTLKIMGDLRGDGNLSYVEYRHTAGANCTGTLVRSDSSAFATAQTPAVTVAENLCNDSAASPPTPLFSYTTPCRQGVAPACFSYVNYTAANGSPCPLTGTPPCPAAATCTPCPPGGAFMYVTSVTVNLIVRTPQPTESGGGGARTIVMRQTFVPRNVMHAMILASEGLQNLLPVKPSTVPVP